MVWSEKITTLTPKQSSCSFSFSIFTFRRSVQSEPQLEPVRVVDFDFFQLWFQQDVFLGLWGDRKCQDSVFHLCFICNSKHHSTLMELTWLANSRWQTVWSWGSFITAVMICNMGVIPGRKQQVSAEVEIQTYNMWSKVCGHLMVWAKHLGSKRKISISLHVLYIKKRKK